MPSECEQSDDYAGRPVTRRGVFLGALFVLLSGGGLAYCSGYFSSAEAAESDLIVIEGPARVIDGDTIEVFDQVVRLHGIDAMELDQTCTRDDEVWDCGVAGREKLQSLIRGAPVRCEGTEFDFYDRLIAECEAIFEADDPLLSTFNPLNASMVGTGFAVAYLEYSDDYASLEALARMFEGGIWAWEFERPDVYRARIRAEREAAREPTLPPDPNCVIKGNISRNSDNRIFHVPGQADYEATRIDPDRGERWFCTEDEAIAAGWRKALR